MSIFTNTKPGDVLTYHVEASHLLGKPMWAVTEPFEYRVGSLESSEVVKVPKGFLTDGSSLPSSLLKLALPWAKNGLAIIVHDYLYDKQYLDTDEGRPMLVDYDFADEIFTEALSVLGVSKYKRVIVKVALLLWRMFKTYREGSHVDLPMAKSAIENSIRLNLESDRDGRLAPAQVSSLKSNYPMLKKTSRGARSRW